jgi:hypothetical protein
MLWSVTSGDKQWITVDAIYCVGILFLALGLLMSVTSKRRSWIMPVIGGLLIMFAFLGRFSMLLTAGSYELHGLKIIALTRCILHTLVLPLILVFVWLAVRLLYEQVRGRRKWWQTGSWLALVIFCAWGCGCCIWFFYTHCGTYPGKSPFP